MERYNAHLVAKGFTQTFGIVYTITFAPITKLNAVQILLSMALNFDWQLQQLDVKNAYLNGSIKEKYACTHLQDLKNSLGQKYAK